MQGKPYDGKTDVWAIGCVLYEMCALKKAFDASNLGAITVKVMRSAHSLLLCTLCCDWKLKHSMLQLLRAQSCTTEHLTTVKIINTSRAPVHAVLWSVLKHDMLHMHRSARMGKSCPAALHVDDWLGGWVLSFKYPRRFLITEQFDDNLQHHRYAHLFKGLTLP